VDQIQVDLVHAEPLQALPGLGHRVVVPGMELGSDEDLIARHSVLAQSRPLW
jgi:hypothetical protein